LFTGGGHAVRAILGHPTAKLLTVPFVEDEVSDMAGKTLGDYIEILGHNATIDFIKYTKYSS
jgi:hypothetical protein